jgi:Trypsin-like serine proteases, typically periplasmic, contain C-terminal PDZ domain
VAEVTEGGPASEAGVESGDVILRFDDRDVEDMRDLPRMVAETTVGETVRMTVWRDGATQTLRVTLGRLEEAEAEVAALSEDAGDAEDGAQNGPTTLLGMGLAPLTDARRDELGLDAEATGVVVVAVDEGSAAFEKGVRAGDLVVEVGQNPVASAEEIEERIAEAQERGRRTVLFLMSRDGEPRFVALPPEE